MGKGYSKKLVLLSVMVLGLLLVFSGISTAATLTVGTGKTYATIQAAVDAASSGDTIDVYSGTYRKMSASIKTTSRCVRSMGKAKRRLQGMGAPTLSTSMKIWA